MSEPGGGPVASADEDLEDLYENAPFGYLSLTPGGQIVRTNATFARWIGFTPEALAAKPFRDLLTVPGRIFYETNFAPVLRLQSGFEELALDLVTSGGEKLPVLANGAARPGPAKEGRITRIGIMRAKDRRGYERDLHGRAAAAQKKLEDERENAELREQFIAVLGHDLRNPLASIVGAARLLRREAPSEKAMRVLGLMETSVDRMAGLIDDVMDFARGRLGAGISLDREVAPLEPVLRQVVQELEASEPSRVFVCDIAVDEPVSFDAGRIAQLVSNLLGNALTHGDPKTPVQLGAKLVSGDVEIWVANAGSPIPPKAMDRLFQPFFRGEVRPSQQGLGLGLHIASEIAKAHRGSLTVQSDAAETRFTLAFPSF